MRERARSEPVDMQAYYSIGSFVEEVFIQPNLCCLCFKWGLHEMDSTHQLSCLVLDALMLLIELMPLLIELIPLLIELIPLLIELAIVAPMLVLIELPMPLLLIDVVIMPLLIERGWEFYPALGAGLMTTILGYLLMIQIMEKYGLAA